MNATRRQFLRRAAAGSAGLAGVLSSGGNAAASSGQRGVVVFGGESLRPAREVPLGTAQVEMVRASRTGNVLDVYLVLNAGLHHLARLGGDIRACVTVIYSSGGHLVTAQSPRLPLGSLDARGVLDSGTVHGRVAVPFGTRRPDPGTAFTARANVFTLLPG